MAQRQVLHAFAKLTGVFLLVSILFRMLAAFNVQIEGQQYSDIAFFTFLAITVVGYGRYYTRFFYIPLYPRVTTVLGLAAFFLTLASVVFPVFPFGITRSMVFWTGVIIAGIVVIMISIGFRRFVTEWEGKWGAKWRERWWFDEEWRWQSKEYEKCAEYPGELSTLELGEPQINHERSARIVGFGVKIRVKKNSLVYPAKTGTGVAIAGNGVYRSLGGAYSFDGLLLVNSACSIQITGMNGTIASDKDAQDIEFSSLAELRHIIAQEQARLLREATMALRDDLSKQTTPLEAAERSVDLGIVKGEEGAEGKEVHMPGIHVVERKGSTFVQAGPVRIVEERGKEEEGEEELVLYGALGTNSKPVTVIKTLGAVKRTILIGDKWVIKKRENGGA